MSTETTEPTGPIKVGAYFTPSAMAALELAAEATGDSHTDTINRALQVYAGAVVAKPGQSVQFDVAPGVYRTLIVRDERPGFWAQVRSALGRGGR